MLYLYPRYLYVLRVVAVRVRAHDKLVPVHLDLRVNHVQVTAELRLVVEALLADGALVGVTLLPALIDLVYLRVGRTFGYGGFLNLDSAVIDKGRFQLYLWIVRAIGSEGFLSLVVLGSDTIDDRIQFNLWIGCAFGSLDLVFLGIWVAIQ